MEGRKLKDHVIQVYQAIKQVLSYGERENLFKSLQDYKQCHQVDQLALELCKLCTSLERLDIVRNIWIQIIHQPLSEFNQILKEHPFLKSDQQSLLNVDQFSRESQLISHTGELLDENNQRGLTYMFKVHNTEDISAGFCIRGGLEHGLGIYISGIEAGSAAEESGLKIGDKILEVNNISFYRLPSSTAINVLTGSKQLKLIVERTGRIPEWRLSRERTVWFDCQNRKLTHGVYEELDKANFFRGIDVNIPERCVTLSNITEDEDLGFNIRGGNEYRLGIFVSKVNSNSRAELSGIQTGDQITDVNGISFDNISHANAVETLKAHTHLIVSLRDVGRYPAYKEICAEYTWTSTTDGVASYYEGERLIERKLSDTWIESNFHKKKKSLHLRVPVEITSHQTENGIVDSLHPDIYLPENVSHPSLSIHSDVSSDEDSFIKPVDTWIRRAGHSNPTFQPDDMGDNSTIDSRSVQDNSSSDDQSGIQGQYTVTMDDILRKKEIERHTNPKLNIYEYMIHKSDAGSGKEIGRKSVERYIFDDHVKSNTSLHGNDRDDIRSETLSRESLVIDDDDDTQSYHSTPTFSTFAKTSFENKHVSLTSLNDWRKSVESLNIDNSAHLMDETSNHRESNTEDFDNKRKEEDFSGEEDNFPISVVPGSVYTTQESRYRKREDNKSKNSRYKSTSVDRMTNRDKINPEFTQVRLYEIMNESTDDPSDGQNIMNVENDTESVVSLQSGDDLTSSVNKLNIKDNNLITDHGSQSELYETWSLDNMNSQTELVMHDFDRKIQNLENRKSELGMYEMYNMSSKEDLPVKTPAKKERRGSRIKLSRKKSTDLPNKRSSWKILQKKIRSGLFKRSTGNNETERKADFIWSKYNPNTFDEHGLELLETSAMELFDPDEVITIIRHVKNYHEDHNVGRLVDYLLIAIDIPEKILLLKDVRKVIYKFDMCHFDELVKQFEIDAYEKLSTSVHQQLNHDKRGKPRKHILEPETDDFGHFYIKPTTKQKEKEQEIQSYEENSLYHEQYGKDIIVTQVPKHKPMLGLCISGGVEYKQQPQIKVDEVIEGGAAAEDPRIQRGMTIVAIDDTDLRQATHTDAILALKKSFSNKRTNTMMIVLTDSVTC